MGEEPLPPYTERDRVKVIILSALLGWAGFTVMELYAATKSQILYLLPFFAVIGLPIALLSTWVIGGPIIRRILSKPVGWLRAAFGGASVAAVLAAMSIVLGRLNGLRIAGDDSFHFQLGGGDFVREVDGILTPYGWQLLAQSTAGFIALGAGVGLLVRAVIGPGKGAA